MKRFLFFMMCLSFLAVSCNEDKKDAPEENYDELFPFEGIDKPESEFGDVVIRPCNPDALPEDYIYPGIDEVLDRDEYDVTLRYRFTEPLDASAGSSNVASKYILKYINKDKKEVMVCSDKNYELAHPEDVKDVIVSHDMENNEWYTVRFKAYSGFPMKLCVNGTGPRDSSIEAEITAVSVSGLTPDLRLETRQYQNKEGIDRLAHPYCNFIVLP